MTSPAFTAQGTPKVENGGMNTSDDERSTTMYVVIESTPGYLPDEDDPATFDNIEDARVYASDRLSSLLDFLLEVDDDDISVLNISGSFQEDTAVLVTDTRREHDLGRVIEIVEDES